MFFKGTIKLFVRYLLSDMFSKNMIFSRFRLLNLSKIIHLVLSITAILVFSCFWLIFYCFSTKIGILFKSPIIPQTIFAVLSLDMFALKVILLLSVQSVWYRKADDERKWNKMRETLRKRQKPVQWSSVRNSVSSGSNTTAANVSGL